MSATIPTAISTPVKPAGSQEAAGTKRGPKPKDTSGIRELYFVGDLKDGKPVLEEECRTEQAAQMRSLNTGKPYFVIHVWSIKKSSVA